MNSTQRREEILRLLRETDGAINATALAGEFGVTRQIIVADIALLRSAGHQILSGKYGYSVARPADGILETVVCRHNAGQTQQELYAVVDNGGAILNVIVEHPVFGAICADLNIASRYDADEFIRQVRDSRASLLSELTGGLHTHTLRVPDEDTYTRICEQLERLRILVKEETAASDVPTWMF